MSIESKTQSAIESIFSILVTDSYGIYIPSIFCESLTEEDLNSLNDVHILECIHKIRREDSALNYEHYWEDWEYILNSYRKTVNGIIYSIYQSGDLWLVNETELDKMTDSDKDLIWESIA